MDNYGTRKAICQMLFYLSCQQGVPENQLKKMGKKKGQKKTEKNFIMCR